MACSLALHMINILIGDLGSAPASSQRGAASRPHSLPASHWSLRCHNRAGRTLAGARRPSMQRPADMQPCQCTRPCPCIEHVQQLEMDTHTLKTWATNVVFLRKTHRKRRPPKRVERDAKGLRAPLSSASCHEPPGTIDPWTPSTIRDHQPSETVSHQKQPTIRRPQLSWTMNHHTINIRENQPSDTRNNHTTATVGIRKLSETIKHHTPTPNTGHQPSDQQSLETIGHQTPARTGANEDYQPPETTINQRPSIIRDPSTIRNLHPSEALNHQRTSDLQPTETLNHQASASVRNQ